jgi:WD40 repeat protein
MKPAAVRLVPQLRYDSKVYPVDLVWSADASTLLLASGDGELVRVDARREAPLRVLGAHSGGALAVAWQRAGPLFASSGQDGEVRLWDSRSDTAEVIASGDWSEHLAFSPDGRSLAVATGRRLRLFDANGQEAMQLPEGASGILALAWKPMGRELAAVGNGGLRVHQLGAAVQSRDYPWKGACLTASWRADGRVLASGLQDGSVHFWNLAAGSQSQMRGYGARVLHTSWSANSRYLATAADQRIVVWDFTGRGPEGSAPLEFTAHTERVTQLHFAPHGPYLLSASRDRRLLLWRPGTAAEPLDADLLGDEVLLVRFSRDGERVAVADRGGALTLYALTRSPA